MRLLDISLNKPEENLALDEVLLNGVESGRKPEVLRFWESPSPFVVLGVSQQVRQEINERECREDGIPVFRRCSAGGCVLQGPGCLNYSLVLSHDCRPEEVRMVRGSYCYILEKICAAFEAHGVNVKHKGISDLAWAGRKVSGSAQKRRKHAFLHHGTLLYGMNTALMVQYLREPEDRPQYRGERTHTKFVRLLPFTGEQLKAILCEAFEITGRPEALTRSETLAMRALAKETYASQEYIYRR